MWNQIKAFPIKELRSELAHVENTHNLFTGLFDTDSFLIYCKYTDPKHMKESLGIEGVKVTLDDTTNVLNNKIPTHLSFDTNLELINMASVIKYMRICLRRNIKFTEELMLQFHQMLGANLLTPDNCGKYRKVPVMLNSREYQTATIEQVPKLMKQLFLVLEEEKHPLIAAAHFHYNLVCIHPFVDFNGRLARLCENYILMSAMYPPNIIKESERKHYINLLKTSSTPNKYFDLDYTKYLLTKVQSNMEYLLYHG